MLNKTTVTVEALSLFVVSWLEEQQGLGNSDADKTTLLRALAKAGHRKSVDTTSDLTNISSVEALQKLVSDFLKVAQLSHQSVVVLYGHGQPFTILH